MVGVSVLQPPSWVGRWLQLSFRRMSIGPESLGPSQRLLGRVEPFGCGWEAKSLAPVRTFDEALADWLYCC